MNLIPSPAKQSEPSFRRWLLAQLMRIANRNGHPRWYACKTRLLAFYASPDGFDTQRYEAPCWNCVGGTDYTGNECWQCNAGVHHITRTMLHRYVIEGVVFHQIARFRIFYDEELDAIEHLEGWSGRRITTKKGPGKTSVAASMEAEAWILLLCGGYRALWQWLNGAGLAYRFVGYPLGTLRWLLTRPREWRYRLHRAWADWRLSRGDVPF